MSADHERWSNDRNLRARGRFFIKKIISMVMYFTQYQCGSTINFLRSGSILWATVYSMPRVLHFPPSDWRNSQRLLQFFLVAFRFYFNSINQERNADLPAPTGHRGRWESPFRNKRHRWKPDQSYSPSPNHPFPSFRFGSLSGKYSSFNPISLRVTSPLQGNAFTCQVCSSDESRWTLCLVEFDSKGCP